MTTRTAIPTATEYTLLAGVTPIPLTRERARRLINQRGQGTVHSVPGRTRAIKIEPRGTERQLIILHRRKR